MHCVGIDDARRVRLVSEGETGGQLRRDRRDGRQRNELAQSSSHPLQTERSAPRRVFWPTL